MSANESESGSTLNGHSELFTVRLWTEELEGERIEYRGQVKHVISGATSNFRDWSDLATFLVETIDDYKGGAYGHANR